MGRPGYNHLLQRLGAFTRLIQFDKRGTGLSDRVDNRDLPSLETRMDDVGAAMDAAGSGRAALLGASEGAPMSILFAATYPERTRALVLYGGYAHFHPKSVSWRQLTDLGSYVGPGSRSIGLLREQRRAHVEQRCVARGFCAGLGRRCAF